jgi:hypothetical protein
MKWVIWGSLAGAIKNRLVSLRWEMPDYRKNVEYHRISYYYDWPYPT